MGGLTAMAPALLGPLLGSGATADQQQRRYDHDRLLQQQAIEADRQSQAAALDAERGRQEAELRAERERREWALAQLRSEQDQSMDQLISTQNLGNRQASAETANRLEELRTAAEADERRRRQALRRAVAKQRARFGARGVSAAGGSGEAILLGLVDETAEERREAEQADRLRAQALRQSLADRNRRNLLEQSQLAERHRLQMISRLG